jgi:similar to stage IV sporulation protein
MRNHFLMLFEKIITVSIKGKNIDHFLSYIYKQKIIIIDLKVIDRNEIRIKIYEKDMPRIENIKTSNEIEIVDKNGILKIKEFFIHNKYIILSLIIGYILLIVLSNIIFEVQVIHNDKDIRSLLYSELKLYNIRPLHFKKSYKDLEKIEDEILENNKKNIEWLEIEEVGTKYIIRVEERKIPIKEEEYIYQDIVASKNAVIIKVEAQSGIILKNTNDYVKVGDIVISGLIKNGDKLTNIIKASGKIYGEVWYNIRVEFPMIHSSKKETGKTKTTYSIKFLNYRIPLTDFVPYKYKKINEKVIVYNYMLPFKIIKEHQYELKVTDSVYNEGEALLKAEKVAEEKVKAKLSLGEYIISNRILRYYQENQILYLDMFFKVCEDIGEPKQINIIDNNLQ